MSILIVDGGGTKTRGWLIENESSRVLRDVVVGPSNINSIGEEGVRSVLSELLQKLPDHSPTAAVFGLAGLGRPAEAEKAEAIIEKLLPKTQAIVTTDARLAYAGAFAKSKHGILLIAGTGTIALYQNPTGREFFRAGGWGSLLGDEGGGIWLGREALRHCLFEWEHNELSAFHEQVLEIIGAETSEGILTQVYQEGFSPAMWSSLAPLVFTYAKEDPRIMKILRRAAVHLVGLAERLIENLPQSASSLRLVIIGGLWEQQAILKPLFEDEIEVRNLPLSISEPDGGPLEGGLALLRQSQ
jgi:N-acetylglucosamine kinase-like BadF-type ATPase